MMKEKRRDLLTASRCGRERKQNDNRIRYLCVSTCADADETEKQASMFSSFFPPRGTPNSDETEKQASMFSSFFPPRGTPNSAWDQAKPGNYDEFLLWKKWFKKLTGHRSRPDISRLYEELPGDPTQVACKDSMYLFSGGLVESLNGSANFSSSVLTARWDNVYAYDLKADFLDAGANDDESEDVLHIPRIENIGEFDCEDPDDPIGQICSQYRATDEAVLVAVRFPKELKFLELSRSSEVEGGEISFKKIGSPSIELECMKTARFAHFEFDSYRPGIGLASMSNGGIFAYDVETDYLSIVAVALSKEDSRPFEPWYKTLPTKHPYVAYCADRTRFRILDLRMTAVSSSVSEFSIVKPDEKITEEVFNLEVIRSPNVEESKILVITSNDVLCFDRRFLGPRPIWRKKHLMDCAPLYATFLPESVDGQPISEEQNAIAITSNDVLCFDRRFLGPRPIWRKKHLMDCAPLYATFLPESVDGPPISEDYPPGSLVLAGHEPNAISIFDLREEGRRAPSEQMAFEAPMTSLGGCEIRPFWSYRSLATPQEVCRRLVERGEFMTDKSMDECGLPMLGFANHVVNLPKQGKMQTLLTTIGTGWNTLFASVKVETESEEKCADVSYQFCEGTYRSVFDPRENEKGQRSVDVFVGMPPHLKRVVVGTPKKPGFRIRQRIVGDKKLFDSKSESLRKFTRDILDKKREIAFAGGESFEHLCRGEKCDGSLNGGNADFKLENMDVESSVAEIEAKIASAKYLFVPGMMSSLYLEDESGGEMNKVAKEALAEIRRHMEIIPTNSPYLPGKNVELKLSEPEFTEEEREFLFGGESEQPVVLDNLMKEILANTVDERSLRKTVVKLDETEVKRKVAEMSISSFMDATQSTDLSQCEASLAEEKVEKYDFRKACADIPIRWRIPRSGKHSKIAPHGPSRIADRLNKGKYGRMMEPTIAAAEALLMKEVYANKGLYLGDAKKVGGEFWGTMRRKRLLAEFLDITGTPQEKSKWRPVSSLNVSKVARAMEREGIPLSSKTGIMLKQPERMDEDDSEDEQESSDDVEEISDDEER
ncbi:unnamed protein product [Notodromas monacha]|uniref:Uncharacterized protein n=1 Tax=Notodromas monacha TaxID=399045 RepID=A0A7R9GCA5_9CRUS|nr:unnamed protein product [Notodromas monacha]CAG0915777.1 unnamed protein product [Notodromas monacha]